MKNITKIIKLPFFLLMIIFSFISCEEDFNDTESNVLGNDNSNFKPGDTVISVITYNKKLEALQIDNLSSNLLGFYKDPAFGETTASIITQLTPATFNPDFGDNPTIKSVVLKIPYYSRVIGTKDDGSLIYTINDSLFGEEFDEEKTIHPFKLSIYQNTYFIRDFDPSSELNENQKYYSNGSSPNNSVLNGTTSINFDDFIGELFVNKELTPSSNSIKIQANTIENDTDEDIILTPAMYYSLDTGFWKTLIIDKQGDPVLSNSNNFRNYFRGLYFKAEAKDGNGSMVLLNLNSTSANITIHYSKDSSIEGETINDTYVLNFSGYKLNTFINDYNVPLADGDNTNGDEKLYLKGAEGSMAVVDLFEDDTALNDFKNDFRVSDGNGGFKLKKLINEAQLVIYEDDELIPESDKYLHKYDRIYAYDIKNNLPTSDYLLDPTGNYQDPFNSKVISIGQRITDDSGDYKYKIRLTEHIKDILLKDSTNTKIGLVLSTNVNNVDNSEILNNDGVVSGVPTSSVITPKGTILYGNKVSEENEHKKMRLEIFYTEPK